MRVPWTARRSNQSFLKEINLEYSLEGLMLKLKFQYFGYLMQRVDSLEKTLVKIEGKRIKRWQRIRWLDNITDSMDMNLSKLQEKVEHRGAWCITVHGVTESDTTVQLATEQQFWVGYQQISEITIALPTKPDSWKGNTSFLTYP